MIKRLVATILAVICLLHVAVTAYAHTKEGSNGHDQYMSWILFGSKTYKDTLPETSKEIKAIEALENAVALCIDQYNGSYGPYLLGKLTNHCAAVGVSPQPVGN